MLIKSTQRRTAAFTFPAPVFPSHDAQRYSIGPTWPRRESNSTRIKECESVGISNLKCLQRARAWQGVAEILGAWEPLQDKLDAGEELEVWDCSTFGAQLLAWNEEHRKWAGSTLSTALHK